MFFALRGKDSVRIPEQSNRFARHGSNGCDDAMVSERERDWGQAGLCAGCRHSRRMTSDRGSVFWFCELSKEDARFVKYPRLPVRVCAGYERVDQGVSDEGVILYRPVGQAEFELIRESGFRKFPPRLPQQPYFYPVLNEEYATQIARDWNTRDEASSFVGCVLRFRVKKDLLRGYEIKTVGSSKHQEYWIPAGDLEKLNQSIIGMIEVVSEFPGSC
jgi:hypothetical protein